MFLRYIFILHTLFKIKKIEWFKSTTVIRSRNRCIVLHIRLALTALLSDRYGVSDRTTAAISSSVLHDVGFITDSDVSRTIDENKIRKGIQNIRAALRRKTDE